MKLDWPFSKLRKGSGEFCMWRNASFPGVVQLSGGDWIPCESV